MENEGLTNLNKRIIECVKKGIEPKDIAVILNSEGFKRHSDSLPLGRKDINNKITGLKTKGLLPKSSKILSKNNTKKIKGVTMDKLTIEKVKEVTGLSQAKIAELTNTSPGTLTAWKKKGAVPEGYTKRFEAIMGNKTTGVIATSKPKRSYNRKKPILTEVTPEEIGIENNNEPTMFIVTKDKNLINELVSRFI